MVTCSHIFDGTEQPVLHSESVILDSCFFSGKKGQPSINKQITISLDGTILHLSPSFPGYVSDHEIALATQES
jgi:hypothetical protein